MKPDVTINGISMLSLGWLRETVNFPTPQSQSNTITVPGRNSPIRFTEALGRVAFQPRSFDLTFSMLGDRADFDQLVSMVVNQFAGKLCRVTLTEDPTMYAVGTLEAAPFYDPLTGKGALELSCIDGDAFLFHVEETVVNVTGGGTVILANDYMPVVPVITATAEITAAGFKLFQERYRWDQKVRAVCIRATDLVPKSEEEQLSMFIDHAKRDKKERLEDAVEELRGRFGKGALTYAVLLGNLKMPVDGRDKVRMPGLMYE